jgi:hypothetical protein
MLEVGIGLMSIALLAAILLRARLAAVLMAVICMTGCMVLVVLAKIIATGTFPARLLAVVLGLAFAVISGCAGPPQRATGDSRPICGCGSEETPSQASTCLSTNSMPRAFMSAGYRDATSATNM